MNERLMTCEEFDALPSSRAKAAERERELLAILRRLTFQREFLQLAGVWFACRWMVMGHLITDFPSHWQNGLDLALLGMHDHAHEMRLLAAEAPQ